MYQFLFILQAFLMNWYITKIVFNISAENSPTKTQFDEQLRLITADSKEEAFLKARAIGLSEEDTFYNDKMKQVKWEFINVSEVLPLQNLEDGIELYSRIHETDEGSSYINFIHRKAIAIRMNSQAIY
ncbi:MAG: DUF4288 domain-containing protein [Marivirga sp.]|nr:DUF4288 domain-containing protein [Marivirga sp.]